MNKAQGLRDTTEGRRRRHRVQTGPGPQTPGNGKGRKDANEGQGKGGSGAGQDLRWGSGVQAFQGWVSFCTKLTLIFRYLGLLYTVDQVVILTWEH